MVRPRVAMAGLAGALCAALVGAGVGRHAAVGQGAEVAEYRISLPDSAELRPGAAAAISLTVAARAGYRISRDAPVQVDLAADPREGLLLPKRRYRRRDAADARADDPRFDLALRAERAGEWRLAVELRFWVCADRSCRPVSERRQVAVRAALPPPPDAGVGGGEPGGQ